MDKQYRVTAQVVSRIDIVVGAETMEEAMLEVLKEKLWRDEPDDMWYEHEAGIVNCIEVDDEGGPVV